MSEQRHIFLDYLRARFPVIGVVTPEEERFVQTLASEWAGPVRTWSLTRGIDECESTPTPPPAVLQRILSSEQAPDTVWVLKDYGVFMGDAAISRTLRDMHKRRPSVDASGGDLGGLVGRKVHIVLLCNGKPPQKVIDAVPEVTFLDFERPDRDELLSIATAARAKYDGDPPEALADALGGMTKLQSRNALALSKLRTGALRSSAGLDAKAEMLAAEVNGLSLVRSTVGVDDVGGLGALREWCEQMGSALQPEARSFGLSQPKGALLTGPPGTGKSLMAQWIASLFGITLWRGDMGALMGSLVGQSEGALRKMIQVCEASAPCILWLDEIEKAISSGQVGGGGDSGTSSRMIGTLITWMSEKTAPVFIVATANDPSKLPVELTRKGRFDEVWFVDLPGAEAREAILNVHLRKRGRERMDEGGALVFAAASQGFSGAEIEAVVESALRRCYFEDRRAMVLSDLIDEVEATTPLSKKGDAVERMRAWAQANARNANGGHQQATATPEGLEDPLGLQ